MSLEKEVITSLLKLTKTGPTPKELLRREAHVGSHGLDEVLEWLSRSGLIRQQHSLVEALPDQRVSMAIQGVKLGADFEQICKFLRWTEFETITAQTFQANGFSVLKNLHFKYTGKCWEIDVIGCSEPLIVCVDCKHWHRGWNSAATVKAVEAHVDRTQAFAKALPNYYQKAPLIEWKSLTLIPLVLSLIKGPFKFHNNVPIVPVLQLQDFISELPLEVNSLRHFNTKPQQLRKKLTEFFK
jgi:Holliday junction resolvase-like predicted endonuclease